MAVSLAIYDSSLVAITAALSTISADSGTPSSETEIVVINNKDGTGADTAVGYGFRLLARLTALDPYMAEGLEPTSEYWVEARIQSGYNQTLSTGPWIGLGEGSSLALPEMTNDTGVRVRFRINAPAGQPDSAFTGKMVLEQVRTSTTAAAAFETGGGIELGLGDLAATSFVRWGGDVVQNPGGADDQVQIQYLVGMVEGVPSSALQQLVQLTNTDGAAAALASGESYIAALSLAADGTITITKGLKATDPVDETDRPAAPTDEPLIAWVTRPFSGTISDAEIVNVLDSRYAALSTNLLNATISSVYALASDRVIRAKNDQTAALTASSTNTLFIRRDGSPGVTTDGQPPADSPQALLTWEVVTDGTGETARTDLRQFVGTRDAWLEFRFTGTLAVNDYSYGSVPPGRWWIHPHRGITATLSDGGSGATSGQTVLDIEVWNGSSWVTIFTSQTSSVPDSGPTIAYDSTDLVDTDAVNEVWRLDGPAVIRGRVAEIPTGGAPDSASVIVRLAG